MWQMWSNTKNTNQINPDWCLDGFDQLYYECRRPITDLYHCAYLFKPKYKVLFGLFFENSLP